MAKTSRDARRHIREWSNFFSAINSVGNEIVEDFINRYRKKKYLKQSLERLVARGFLSTKDNKFKPTIRGIRFFRRNKTHNRKDDSVWDKKWRLVSFDVPGSYNLRRDQIRALLKEFNFYPLQKSVWICPNNIAEEFWQLIIEKDLDKYCKAMVVEVIEGDEFLRKYFEV